MSFGNEENLSLKKTLPILRFIGQIKQLFIICEGPDGIYLVDQHAAHERILFEQFQKQKNEKAFQMLTINNYYDLGVASNNQIIENIKKFHELGWDIEESPTGGIIVRNIPYQKLHKTKSVDITELLEMISKDLVKKHADTPKEIISKRLACHNAVRAGQKLSENECKELLNNNLPLPAYENCIKASHYFNILDARGVIGVTQRQSYILKIRSLVKSCCEIYIKQEL